ncbi:hypothetical protein RJ640_000832 [Escallonia rubra]|uniref:Integrase zinc-binding domain-containing protein n=1 Tax=Escallonia rubra TaxID=112253 RepID=A0AA88RIL2_9ASTE|nr:hypothetical protein RJ640_000832 [Escallonia rubra]
MEARFATQKEARQEELEARFYGQLLGLMSGILSGIGSFLNSDLFKRTPEGLALRCLGQQEAMQVTAEVHKGVCGAHQEGVKMRWLIRRHGHYWPSIMDDCIQYAKGCQACQRHGVIH